MTLLEEVRSVIPYIKWENFGGKNYVHALGPTGKEWFIVRKGVGCDGSCEYFVSLATASWSNNTLQKAYKMVLQQLERDIKWLVRLFKLSVE